MLQQKKALGGLLVLMLLGLSACDPCYTLAEGMCNCLPANERAACITNIAVAKQLKGHNLAKDENICRKALEKNGCLCKDFLNGNFDECGMTLP